ncbi:hypothetical protein CRU98_10060 [Arcobacter sp. CECT 8986]|uniref:hypothetical protein n=1 Tax=Arcobacter sp. CECT 8986 TaxID=2044507 RepID=UPI001009A6DE|nr:hypothetical protein [Arcobacter sp. CECT 8986]RXJ98373.1 hypothetical protein CRU98_10060 [Arcobacter sp. CECT 8986]
MNWLLDNLGIVSTVIGAVYPTALFLLPAKAATKINVGLKVVKGIANALENAQNSKGGLTTEKDYVSKVQYQRAK